jgi:o-succinylbenzoate synthase
MRCHTRQRSLALRRPFAASGWTIAARDVLIFSITDEETGHTGWGESAPLPAFGTENLSASWEALHSTEQALSGIRAIEIDDNPDLIVLIPALAGVPAARFAVECALIDLRSRIGGRTFAETLGGRFRDRVPVNAVIGAGSADDASAAASAAWRLGYGCIKLKVGAGSLEEDVARIRAVRLAVPADVLLRLDANGAWDFGEAEQALRECALYDIEYIEQPVPAAAIDELAALTVLGILPIAADESAQDLAQARTLLARHAVDLFVVKPMAAGGLRECRRFALEASARGCDVVFTSLIDSSLGRHAVAQLCASLPTSHRHHGLATGELFLEDTHRDVLSEGAFVLPGTPGLGIVPDEDQTGETYAEKK